MKFDYWHAWCHACSWHTWSSRESDVRQSIAEHAEVSHHTDFSLSHAQGIHLDEGRLATGILPANLPRQYRDA